MCMVLERQDVTENPYEKCLASSRIVTHEKYVIFGVLRPSACLKCWFTSNFAVHAQVWKDTWLVELVQRAILYRHKEILVTPGNIAGHMGPKQCVP